MLTGTPRCIDANRQRPGTSACCPSSYDRRPNTVVRAVSALLIAMLILACSEPEEASPAADRGDPGVVSSSGMVVPNTFMTFEGKRYRLVEVLQANLIDEKAFRKVRATQQADIDFAGSLDVFRRDGEPVGLYTFSKGQGTGEAAVAPTWLRWISAD